MSNDFHERYLKRREERMKNADRSDDDVREQVQQLRQQVGLLVGLLGEAAPGLAGSMVPSTSNGSQAAHEVRRVVIDPCGSNRAINAVEQQVIVDPRTREHILQTTIHYTMSWDGRVVRDPANVYHCGECHDHDSQILVDPAFCATCRIPLCSYHTRRRSGEIRCSYH
jgi:hypothetical protein